MVQQMVLTKLIAILHNFKLNINFFFFVVFVKKGDLDIHISKIKHESRILVEEGDITIKMIDTQPVKLTVDANQIIPDTKFDKHGKLEQRKDGPTTMHYSASIHPNVFSPALTVIAENGKVILESQDWAASLGLKMAPPKYKKDELQLWNML